MIFPEVYVTRTVLRTTVIGPPSLAQPNNEPDVTLDIIDNVMPQDDYQLHIIRQGDHKPRTACGYGGCYGPGSGVIRGRFWRCFMSMVFVTRWASCWRYWKLAIEGNYVSFAAESPGSRISKAFRIAAVV